MYVIFMRKFFLFYALLLTLSQGASAQWKKVTETDYVWGPFKIYDVSLFSEDGKYNASSRPIMLRFNYDKPVDGRDFAISLARTWDSLGISLEKQDKVIDRLRKIIPNIKKGDVLTYIALEDRGYFILNNQVIPEELDRETNNAALAVWLDERVDIGRKLLESINKALVQAPQERLIELGDIGEERKAQARKEAEERKAIVEKAKAEKAKANADKLVAQRVAEEVADDFNEVQKQAEMARVAAEQKAKEEAEKIKLQPKSEPTEQDEPEIEIMPPADPVDLFWQTKRKVI